MPDRRFRTLVHATYRTTIGEVRGYVPRSASGSTAGTKPPEVSRFGDPVPGQSCGLLGRSPDPLVAEQLLVLPPCDGAAVRIRAAFEVLRPLEHEADRLPLASRELLTQ